MGEKVAREKAIRFPVTFTKEEKYLYDFAQSNRSVSGYIKDLIEEDMKRKAAGYIINLPKQHIKPEPMPEPVNEPEVDEEEVEAVHDILGGIRV